MSGKCRKSIFFSKCYKSYKSEFYKSANIGLLFSCFWELKNYLCTALYFENNKRSEMLVQTSKVQLHLWSFQRTQLTIQDVASWTHVLYSLLHFRCALFHFYIVYPWTLYIKLSKPKELCLHFSTTSRRNITLCMYIVWS